MLQVKSESEVKLIGEWNDKTSFHAVGVAQNDNPHHALAQENEAPLEIPQREEEEEDDSSPAPPPPQPLPKPSSPTRVENISDSRQSTPLSELSPPPEQDDDMSEQQHDNDDADTNDSLSKSATAPANTSSLGSTNGSEQELSSKGQVGPKNENELSSNEEQARAGAGAATGDGLVPTQESEPAPAPVSLTGPTTMESSTTHDPSSSNSKPMLQSTLSSNPAGNPSPNPNPNPNPAASSSSSSHTQFPSSSSSTSPQNPHSSTSTTSPTSLSLKQDVALSQALDSNAILNNLPSNPHATSFSAPSAPGETSTPTSSTIQGITTGAGSHDPRVVAILDLNVELLKMCMLFQAKKLPPNDDRFLQFSNRLQSNIQWLRVASMHQPGVVPPTPILDPPLPIGDQATVERIRQLYGQMTSNFSRDVKRSSGPTTNGHPTLGGPSPVAGAANGPNNHSPTHSNNTGTPTLPGHVPSFVAPSSTPTPTPLSAGSSTSNLKRDRTDDASGVDGGSAHKRRDTGEGKTPSNGSVRSTPTPTPVLQQQQHMLQQNQLGQNQLNQNSMPPPSTIPISNQVGQSSTPTPTNITPTSGPTSFSVPMSGGTGGRQTRQPTPSTPTSTSPIGGMSSDPSSTAANSVVNNQSSSSGMTPGLAQSQDLQGLNLNINNPVEAQIAAQNRERVRQAQIHQAQQHAIRMNNRMAGGQSGGMSGGGNVGAGGQGGMTGAGGLNPGMLNQQGSQTSGMGGIVPSGGNMGINPPGMGGNGHAQNASGGSGGPQPNQAQIQQALLQILNTPNHPILRFCLQNVPNFENLPTQMQLQKLFAARNHLQQQQQQQMARNGMQNAMQGGQNPAGMNMPGAAGAGGNSLTPQQILQLQQRQQQQMGPGSFSAGTNGPMSPIQHGAIPQNLQNQMVNLGGNQGMPGGGSSGMGMNMSGAGGGGMDPRLSMSNPGGGGNLNPHQRQLLLLQQQQRHAGGGAGSSNMGGGGNPGMGGAGGQFGNMNPGNAAMFTPQQQLAMQIRQQQLNAAAGASSPTHSSSPMGSEFPAGSMSGVGMGIPPNMRGPGTIPGIARSTRSPSDSGSSPMTPRGPPQRVPSMSQEDYNRVMLQQQQQQRNLAAQNPGGFNPHMMGGGGSGNWGQGGGGGGGSQGQGGSNFGMSPPGSATSTSFGNINAPSPTGGQNWGGPGQGGGGMNVGGYPFSASPVGSDFSRHMAGTPGPQQQRQATPQTSPPTDLMSQDFELLNWNNQ